MNFRDLQYLVTVEKHLHFGKAAIECNVSQPALSMQIRKFEDSLGVKIFERTNKSVKVTSNGRDILQIAKRILRDLDSLENIKKYSKDPFAIEVKLGAFPTLAPYIFPHIIPKIFTIHPKLKILLMEEKTDQLINKLLNGDIDMALLALPIDSDKFEVVKLFDDLFYLAVSVHNPLSGLEKVTKKDLKNSELLLLEEGHCLRNQALDVCEFIGASEVLDFRATSLETLRQMVAINIGITLMPQTAINQNSITDQIKYLPFKKPSPYRTIGIVCRKSYLNKDVFKSIGDIIRETMTSLI